MQNLTYRFVVTLSLTWDCYWMNWYEERIQNYLQHDFPHSSAKRWLDLLHLSLASCSLNCVRQKIEKKLKLAIKALKKSINQERFLIRVSGMEYEVARKLSLSPERQESCGPGQQRLASKCGKGKRKKKTAKAVGHEGRKELKSHLHITYKPLVLLLLKYLFSTSMATAISFLRELELLCSFF